MFFYRIFIFLKFLTESGLGLGSVTIFPYLIWIFDFL